MVRIYICDDEPFWIEKAFSLVTLHFKLKSDAEISCFRSPEEMLKVFISKKEPADIVILDIDMPQLNGFDAAEQLKRAYPDTLLLFYTSHEQYVFEAFRFQPFRYIRKEYAETEMRPALTAAVSVIAKRSEKRAALKTKDGIFVVDTKNIVYFENSGRRCNVHLSDGRTLDIRGTVKKLLKLADDPELIMIHSGAAVNVSSISTYSGSEVTLEDGTRLPVSRSRLGAVKDAVVSYWRNRI